MRAQKQAVVLMAVILAAMSSANICVAQKRNLQRPNSIKSFFEKPNLAFGDQAMDLSDLRTPNWRADVHQIELGKEAGVVFFVAGMNFWNEPDGRIHGSNGQCGIFRAEFPSIEERQKGFWVEPNVKMIASLKQGLFAKLEFTTHSHIQKSPSNGGPQRASCRLQL